MNKQRIISSGILAFVLAIFIALIVVFCVYVRATWAYIVAICVIFLIDLAFSIYVANSKREFQIKLCWLFWINALPLVGCLLFVVFGTHPFTTRTFRTFRKSWKEYAKNENYHYSKELIEKHQLPPIYSYNLNVGMSAIYQYNQVQIIPHLVEMYDLSLQMIRNAKKSINIIMYIMDDGIWLRSLVTELVKKHQEGVKVHVIYDWLGCYFKKPHHIIKQLQKYGIPVAIFNPHGINMFKGVTNYRSHQKAIIVDNEVALYGGSNIADEYLTISPKTNYWHDLNFMVSGEIVNSLSISFIHDWMNLTDYRHAKSKKKQAANKELHHTLIHNLQPSKKISKTCNAQFIHSSPDYEEKQIEHSIALLANQAKKSIKLVTPYFVPSEMVLNAIVDASIRGVKVTLMTPRLNDDKQFVIPTNRYYYARLKQTGCEIYEYNGFIHSKYLIVDDEITLTGSNNLDLRSLWINYENALVIQDPEFTSQMNQLFNWDLSHSTKINEEDIHSFDTKGARFKQGCMNFIRPLI